MGRIMDHISKTLEAELSELATRSEQSPPKTSKKTALPKSWISALFLSLNARYTHKWASAIDGIEGEAIDEWGDVLAGLNGADIKRGLDMWRDDWPPTAHEFRKACKQYATAAHRSFDKSKALEHKPDPEIAKTAINELKKKVGIVK